MTTFGGEIYKHNDTCGRFCTFYGTDYPFEIEVTSTTGANVSTIRSFEYQLEAHRYANDCRDTHHILDSNFDQAMVFNTEQISGLLNLNITPKNNAPAILTYPKVNLASIDILFSKEESKFRFNQFWDITKDRGEFTNVRLPIFNTEPNGYIRQINLANVDYAKPAHQHKKFRGTVNSVLLRRTVCGPDRLSIKINNTKVQYSLR
jgi:hypothetical protein